MIKPLSCRLKSSKVNVDLECLLLSEVGIHEKVIKELIYDIHEELSAEWDDIWSFNDVVERFDKGEILWLVLKDNKPISCSWVSLKTRDDLFIYNSWLNPKFRGTDLFEKISLVRNNRFYTLGYKKLLCVTDNIRAEKSLKRIGYIEDNWMDIKYIFWTGGYDSTFNICNYLLNNEKVQPIYIDDRVNHGGYHANPLVVQRDGNNDKYPRKSTEKELERMDWLRRKIYEKIEKSTYLLLETMVINEPIKEDEEISKVVQKYNEWIPESLYIDKNGDSHWLEAQADMVLRFGKQFGYRINYPINNIEDDWYEILDCAIKDGKFYSEKLPEENKDLSVFGVFDYPSRHLKKEDMLKIAEKEGFDELLYYTWTCWYPKNGKPCNECKVCSERIIECKEITHE